jgi:hypothetical protein
MTLRDEPLVGQDRDLLSVEVVTSPSLLPPPRTAPDDTGVRWWRFAVVAIVVVGVVLRFAARGPLWLDEAQSVSIASDALRHLPAALRHDGSPPLWYALLHFWMHVFGDSSWSVRVMAALPAAFALPLIYTFARRLAGREVGQYALLLLAASPFAIRYAVEARMYSLVLLLSVIGAHALLSLHQRPGWRPVAALAVVTSALLYTHYYAMWLVAVVLGTEAWRAVRRSDANSRRAVVGLVVGCVSFVPWLPVLLYQSQHTGAPWKSPPTLNAFIDTVDQWAGGSNPMARLSGIVMLALAVLAVFGRPSGRRGVAISRPAARLPLRLVAVILGTITVAVLTAMASGNAYASRYTSVVTAPFLVLVAMGVVVLPSRRTRHVLVTGLALAGLYVGGSNVFAHRTQAGDIAKGINALAAPGDVVMYCPDQLGPSVSRLVRTSARQVVYPNFAAPERVDWVDYDHRMEVAQTSVVARDLQHLAGRHTIWLVYAYDYSAVRGGCNRLVDDLIAARGLPVKAVARHPSVAENAGLLGFRPRR